MMRKLYPVLATVVLMILSFTTLAAASAYTSWDPVEEQVVDLVNLQRSFYGLSTLMADDRLQTAAELHSEDMAESGYFSHTSLDDTEFWQRITTQGYEWTFCSENIAAGYADAYSVMYGTNDLDLLSTFDITLDGDGFSSWDEVGENWTTKNWEQWAEWAKQNDLSGGWMGSTGHRENILYEDMTDIGVGYYYLALDDGSTIYNHYWTQDFATGDTLEEPDTPDAPEAPIPGAMILLTSGLCGMAGLRRFIR
jgi:uncharacterized protein YkwD